MYKLEGVLSMRTVVNCFGIDRGVARRCGKIFIKLEQALGGMVLHQQ